MNTQPSFAGAEPATALDASFRDPSGNGWKMIEARQ